jgi:serine/threonine-protein kinase HipA
MIKTDAKSVTEIKVYRSEVFVGILKRVTKGTELTFDSKFLLNKRFNFLSVNIKKTDSPYTFYGAGLPPFFAGLLPEGWRFKSLVKALKTSEDDLFTLLVNVGARTVGDVWADLNKKTSKPIKLSQVNFYDLLEKSVLSEDAFAEPAIAGVQEKISASMISLPITLKTKGSEFILKLNPKDKPKLTSNEFYCLELAKKIGIKVNQAKIIKDKDGNEGLLVRRFDRVLKNNSMQMVHQEDLLQIMDRFPADKYRVSMQEIIDAVKSVTSAPLIDSLNAINIYLFSYLVGNGDLHAKNLSVGWLDDSKTRALTPAYDLISTTVFGDHKMALKLDGKDDGFSRSNFINFAKRNGIAEKAIEQSIDKLLKKMQLNLSIMDKIGHDDRSTAWLKKSFEQKAKRLL